MKLSQSVKRLINLALRPFKHVIVPTKNTKDFYLHKYSSYEEYASVQIYLNNNKLNNIWADENTLKKVKEILFDEFSKTKKINGICHGSRNGFEQNFLRSLSDNLNVIGTDISETAKNYENSVQWDFHDVNNEWRENQDFIYTNSLDQSWQPHIALETWLSQLKQKGILIVEHTEKHGPRWASKRDPFGVKPTVMPYVLTMWFGSQISISHSVIRKSNMNLDATLFVIRKNVPTVKLYKKLDDFVGN